MSRFQRIQPERRTATSTPSARQARSRQASLPVSTSDSTSTSQHTRTRGKARLGHSLARLSISEPASTNTRQHDAGARDHLRDNTQQEVVAHVLSPQAGEAPVQRKTLPRSLPTYLQAGIEQLSGIAMDDVQVHYNTTAPTHLHALAYTQGNQIYMGPGQEKHLAHEAWHVAQQKLGRVRPTTRVQGVAVNDNAGLEKEADVMGARAQSLGTGTATAPIQSKSHTLSAGQPIQRVYATVRGNPKKLNLKELKGELSKDGKQLYQYTATRTRYVEVENTEEGGLVVEEYKAGGSLKEEEDEVPATETAESKRKKRGVEEDEYDEKGVKRSKAEETASKKSFVTIAEAFLQAADELDLKQYAEEVNKATQETKLQAEELLAILYDLNAGTDQASMISIVNILKTPLQVASCVETAAHIFEDTGDPSASHKTVVKQTGKTQQSLNTFIRKLTEDVKQNADKNVVYKIAAGLRHGFVVFARQGKLELIQSFANSEHLGQYLKDTTKKKVLTPDQFSYLLQLLTIPASKFTEEKKEEYTKAYYEVFGGLFDADFPALEFTYEKLPLRAEDQIYSSILERMQGNMEKIDTLLKQYDKIKKNIEEQAKLFKAYEKKSNTSTKKK